MMEATISSLHHLREKLMHDFREFSVKEGINIKPNTDNRVLDVCERLYDEEREKRRIYIDLNPSLGLDLDWFVKDFSHQNGAQSLLTLSVDGQGMNIPRLWDIYKGWMHEGADADSAVGHRAEE